MAAVGLRIVEPENDAAFTGNPTVTFRGMLTDRPPELADVPWYFRWYSSLNPKAAQDRYSMNEAALSDAETPFPSRPLGMGSHVITFAASDQAGEADADFEAVQHGGVTGGLDGDGRCVIHVFKADIRSPVGGDVRRVGLTLRAKAPTLWARSISVDGEPQYELNEDYDKYNRLRYRWRFEPTGAPSGRPVLEFTPDPGVFDFEADPNPDPGPEPDPDPMLVIYHPALPSTATGSYRIVLYVEDTLDQGLGQQLDTVDVNLTG